MAVAGVAMLASVQLMAAALTHRSPSIGLVVALVVAPGTALVGGARSSRIRQR